MRKVEMNYCKMPVIKFSASRIIVNVHKKKKMADLFNQLNFINDYLDML